MTILTFLTSFVNGSGPASTDRRVDVESRDQGPV